MTDESEVVASTSHATSMVVWDVPSPAGADTPATVKVGVQCSAGCCLSGQVVEVREQTGALLGATTLGAEAAPGTDALYWGDVTFVAPPTTGVAFLYGDVRSDESRGASPRCRRLFQPSR